MSQLSLTTLIVIALAVLSVVYSYWKTNRIQGNEKMATALKRLIPAFIPLGAGLIVSAVAVWQNDIWMSGVAGLVALTGVASYFNRLRTYMKEFKYETELANMKVLGLWLMWLALFILVTIHVIILIWN